MKRFFSILSSAIIICLITYSSSSGQEKKSEQKIKIIVSDDSGTKVIIDTLIKDGNMKDSIRVKGGKVIFIGDSGENSFMKQTDGSEHMQVFTSSDETEKGEEMKTITVTSSDSGTWTVKDDGEKGKNYEKVIIVKGGDGSDKEMEKTVNVWVEKGSQESTEFKTRSIIAKDGMVITVEGNDEVKVQALTKEIQVKMGINQDNQKKK